MHQQHRATIMPFWSRKKLKPSTSAPGTGLQIVSSFIGEPPVCAGFVLVAVLPVLYDAPARASLRAPVHGDLGFRLEETTVSGG
jgi:hypothetical protein